MIGQQAEESEQAETKKIWGNWGEKGLGTPRDRGQIESGGA